MKVSVGEVAPIFCETASVLGLEKVGVKITGGGINVKITLLERN